HGKIGPRRLMGNDVSERLAPLAERLLRHQQRACAPFELAYHATEVRTDLALDSGIAEELARQRRVLAGRRKNQHALFHPSDHVASRFLEPAVPGSSSTGTPVSTPRKPRSGSPTWMPPSSNRKSRMVRSWLPPRFLITEMA